MDTNAVAASLDSLNEKYPSFLKDYLYNILGALPQPDSVVKYVGMFKKEYQYVYDASQKKIPSFDIYKKQIESGFQFLKYYFPNYKKLKNLSSKPKHRYLSQLLSQKA